MYTLSLYCKFYIYVCTLYDFIVYFLYIYITFYITLFYNICDIIYTFKLMI